MNKTIKIKMAPVTSDYEVIVASDQMMVSDVEPSS